SQEEGFPFGGTRLRTGLRHLHRETRLSRGSRSRAGGGEGRSVSRSRAPRWKSTGILEKPARGGCRGSPLPGDRKADRRQLPWAFTGPGHGTGEGKNPDLEPDVRAGGGVFVNRDVVVDGTLVTVRGWSDNGPWMREFVRLLKRTYPQVIGANRTVTD